MDDIVTKQEFGWQNPNEQSYDFTPLPSTGAKQLRPWQARAYAKLKDESRRLLCVPTGAGKSLEMCALANSDLMANRDMRCIIAVPQRVIAKGFVKQNAVYPDGSVLDWSVGFNFLGKFPKSCVQRLKNFLAAPAAAGVRSRVVLCSHATLALTFGDLKEEGRLGLLKNLTVFIDEAHHVSGYEGDVVVDITNGIGDFTKTVIANKNNKLTLATATFYRGDRLPILAPEQIDQFVRFELPLDEHLREMQYLRSFSYDFVFYRDNPLEAVKNIYKDGLDKALFYLPHVASIHTFSNGDKNEQAEDIRKLFGVGPDEDADGIHHGAYLGKPISAVDLVDDEANRKRRVTYLNENAHLPDSCPDIILALNMGKEGADYPELRSECIFGPRGSLTDIVQMVGRLFRDVEGKPHVSVYHLLPMTLETDDKEKVCDKLSNYHKAMSLCMMFVDVVTPKLTFKLDDEEEQQENKPSCKLGAVDTESLSNLFPDTTEKEKLFKVVQDEARDEKIRTGKSITFKVAKPIIEAAMCKLGKEPTDSSVKRTFVIIGHKSLPSTCGLNTGHIEWSKVKEIDMMGWVLPAYSGICSAVDLKELRDLVDQRKLFASYEDAKNIVQTTGIKTKQQYYEWTDRPSNMPVDARRVYIDKWEGWYVFLGTGSAEWMPFEEAREIVRSKHFKSIAEFCDWDDIPENIPSYKAYSVYKDKWIDWHDFLGKLSWLSYEDAKLIVQTHGFKGCREFYDWKDRPENIPQTPHNVYTDKWEGWPIFLGKEGWLPYEEAKEMVQPLGFTKKRQYLSWKDRPKNIPTSPHLIYLSEWKGWDEFLGYAFFSYHESKSITQAAGIKTAMAFMQWENRPRRVPSNPCSTYKKEWKGWGEFLGSLPRLTYQEIKEIVQSKGFKYARELAEWKDRPENIPLTFHDGFYKEEWEGWDIFLGKTVRMSYEEAKGLVQFAHLASSKEFKAWRNGKNIPSHPEHYYKQEWEGWDIFLGKQWMPYEEAKKIVQCQGFQKAKEFITWKNRPKNMPSNPQKVYKEWTDWYDFLGTSK